MKISHGNNLVQLSGTLFWRGTLALIKIDTEAVGHVTLLWDERADQGW
jgi:hypothetical protein